MKRWIPGPAVVASVLLAGIGAWTAVWLFRGAPGLNLAPGWFYQAVNKGSFDMLLLAAAAAVLPPVVRASFRLAGPRPWAAVGCVLVGSILLQLAVGLVARHQVRGWTERFFVGHGEFTWRARDVPDSLALLQNYETLAAQNQLGLYGPSKPPGTYAVYLLLDRTSRWGPVEFLVQPFTAIVARDPVVPPANQTLFAWTILVLGSCTAFTTLPLFWLSRWLLRPHVDEDAARVFTFPAWLFAAAPATNVITVHLDGSVFPLLSAASTALCAGSVRLSADRAVRRPAVLAAIGGVCAMLAVYCSYGNLPIFAVCAAVSLALAAEQRGRVLRSAGLALTGLGGGALLAFLLLRFWLGWQPIAGYLRGVGYHIAWRPNLPEAWRRGLAVVEFSVFAGPPLMAAFLVSSLSVVRKLGSSIGRRPAPVSAPSAAYGSWGLTLATVAVMCVISFAFGTPEAARLWLFMLPWVCGVASLCLVRSDLQRAFTALLLAQVVLAFFVKNYLVW